MTSPRVPEDAVSEPATMCVEPDCERPAVPFAGRCRLHLADAMRADGENLRFDDPELSAMYAVAVHLVRGVVDGLRAETLDAEGPWTEVAMAAGINPDAPWHLAYLGLAATPQLQARLAFAFGTMIQEYVAREALGAVLVKPAGTSDGS